MCPRGIRICRQWVTGSKVAVGLLFGRARAFGFALAFAFFGAGEAGVV